MRGKVAIVTDGLGGMARAVCLRFAGYGVKLAVTELKAAAAQRVTEAIGAAGGQTIAVDAPGIVFDPDAA
jgi:2-hydroxycyclohexanecarboxyl-CoA dehydrogenase